jgi:hypothetical protein
MQMGEPFSQVITILDGEGDQKRPQAFSALMTATDPCTP